MSGAELLEKLSTYTTFERHICYRSKYSNILFVETDPNMIFCLINLMRLLKINTLRAFKTHLSTFYKVPSRISHHHRRNKFK